MKKKNLIIIAILVIIAGAIGLYYYNASKEVHIDYDEFLVHMVSEEIEEATFTEDRIYFKLKDNEDVLYTDNSESQTLKEDLLMSGASINTEKTFTDIFYEVFDYLFVILFVVAIWIGLGRLTGRSLFKVVRKEKTRFSDVVGMDSLKEEMTQIIDIMKNKETYAAKGIKAPKGIILEGEPGNGKTLFARALAGEASIKFIAAKGADFESAVVAVGPAKVRSLFRIARKNAPCIVFIDEFDGIGTKRNYSGNAIETENTRIVTAMLNELDGFKKNDGVLVIAATNNSKVLDEALIRPGRFDRKYLIPYPNKEDRIKLIEFYSKEMKFDESVSFEKLASEFNGMSSSKIETIVNEAAIIAARTNDGVINSKCINESINLTKNK